jgi:hypothetical protein
VRISFAVWLFLIAAIVWWEYYLLLFYLVFLDGSDAQGKEPLHPVKHYVVLPWCASVSGGWLLTATAAYHAIAPHALERPLCAWLNLQLLLRPVPEQRTLRARHRAVLR